jgi:hypothetical protein
MSAKTETYISFIKNQLESNIVDWKTNLGLFEGKFGLKEDTFTKYWKIANEAYLSEKHAIEEKVLNETIPIKIEVVKSQIYDKAKFIEDIENDIKDTKDLIKKGYILKKFTIDGKEEIKKEIFGVKEIESLNRILDSKYELLKKAQGWDAVKKVEQKNTHEMIGLAAEFVDRS